VKRCEKYLLGAENVVARVFMSALMLLIYEIIALLLE
jgi:hypothetical protein